MGTRSVPPIDTLLSCQKWRTLNQPQAKRKRNKPVAPSRCQASGQGVQCTGKSDLTPTKISHSKFIVFLKSADPVWILAGQSASTFNHSVRFARG